MALLEAIRASTKRYRSTPRLVVNWRTWAVRRMLSAFVAVPCRLVTEAGSQFVLGRDLIDDYILEDVLGPLRNVYFPPELNTIHAPLVLQIGAHSGLVAVELLRRSPNAQLIAVEPSPRLVRRLRRNLTMNAMNGRCEILQAAIAEQEGRIHLRTSKEGSWGNSTHPGRNEVNYLSGGVSVQALTLPSILQGREPHIIICNAEGAELVLVPQLIALGLSPQVMVLMTHSRHDNPIRTLEGLRSAGFDTMQVGLDPEHFHCRPRGTRSPAQIPED